MSHKFLLDTEDDDFVIWPRESGRPANRRQDYCADSRDDRYESGRVAGSVVAADLPRTEVAITEWEVEGRQLPGGVAEVTQGWSDSVAGGEEVSRQQRKATLGSREDGSSERNQWVLEGNTTDRTGIDRQLRQ